MTTLVEQMMLNDLNRIDRAISARKKRLNALTKNQRSVPHRYVLDIPIDIPSSPVADDPRFSPVERSFVVDKQSKCFRVTEIVATPNAIGTLPDGTADKVSMPMFSNTFSYQWQVRDTFTDRAWQSDWLPDLLLASGKSSGLRVHSVTLPPGTRVSFTLMPLSLGNNPFVDDVVSYGVQVSFVGHEVL